MKILSLIMAAAVAAALASTGCIGLSIGSRSTENQQQVAAPGPSQTVTISAGLPANARMIGGGYRIDWSPPKSEPGTVMLFDRLGGRLLVSQHVDDKQGFKFDADNSETREFLSRAARKDINGRFDFVMYFLPDQATALSDTSSPK